MKCTKFNKIILIIFPKTNTEYFKVNISADPGTRDEISGIGMKRPGRNTIFPC